MTCEHVVERFGGEIAFGAAAVFGKTPMKMSGQPLGNERRHNRVDKAGGVADREHGPRSFGLPAVNTQYRRQNEFDARKLQIFGALVSHAAPPLLPIDRRRGGVVGLPDRAVIDATRLSLIAPVTSACRSILSVPVLGSSGRNSTKRGYL